MIYIFDIDGTLADITHRLHYIEQVPKDWESFFQACEADKPIETVVALARALRDAGQTILMLTGRSELIRDKTFKWLRQHLIPCDALYMRKDGDHRPDDLVKPQLLAKLCTEWRRDAIVGIFEDRATVVKAFRNLGYTVFQVAEGNF